MRRSTLLSRFPAPLLVLFLALFLALGAGCASAPSSPPTGSPAPSRGAEGNLPLAPEITHGRLENGLRYFIRENHKPEERAVVWLVVNAGSLQEDEDQRGLAHFVEHMAFNGTRHFEKQELVDYMELVGMRFGPDVNAYTSFDETVYMLQVPTDDPEIFDKALLILQDWAAGLSLEGEEIDKERGVVLEEWRLGQGAGARLRDKQFPVLFQGSRYALRLPIGDEQIIQHAPHDVLRRYYRDWYRPDLMAVIVVGAIDPAAVEAKVREGFSNLAGPRKPRPREPWPVPEHDGTRFAIATDPEARSTSASIYYKLGVPDQGTEEGYRRSLVEGLHHSMLGSRLSEIVQRADPPFLSAGTSAGAMVRTREMYVQRVRVEEGLVEAGLAALLREVERVERFGFTATELERARKDFLRSYEQLYRERDKARSSSLASELSRHFLEGEAAPGIEVELALAQRFLPTVTLDEVNHLSREWIGHKDRAILVSAPENEAVPPPTEKALLAVLQAVEGEELEPWEDQVRQGPLLPEKPAPGTITAERSIDEIGVTEWTLSNGITVVMKPTDFQNDELLLSGFSPGGHSLVPDAQYVTAAAASQVLRAGGLGEFSNAELSKALAGTVARAFASITELEENVSGRASPQDAETMFELLYLSMTAPRADPEAFESWRQRVRGSLENRLASPGAVFGDRWMLELYQDHPRRQPPLIQRINEIDLDLALELFEERFADVGDFIFLLVGNFDPEEIRPLVLMYLGGLPAAGREESWTDVGVRRPQGVVEFEVRKGLEPKSQVRLAFTQDAEWSREAQHDLISLASALRIRLREVMREDMGGVYGVGVNGRLSRRPRPEARFSVSFGCAPENVEELVAAVFDEIAAVQENGVDEDVLEKVREGQRRQREISLKENGFWLRALETYYTYDRDPRGILEYDDLVARVTSGNLQEAAHRFVSKERYALGVLNPEEGTGVGAGASTSQTEERDQGSQR